MALSGIVCQIQPYWSKIANFFIPHLYLAPRTGWPRRNLAKAFHVGKTRKICDNMLSRFHLIGAYRNVTDGRTDRQTDRWTKFLYLYRYLYLYLYRASVCWRAIKIAQLMGDIVPQTPYRSPHTPWRTPTCQSILSRFSHELLVAE